MNTGDNGPPEIATTSGDAMHETLDLEAARQKLVRSVNDRLSDPDMVQHHQIMMQYSPGEDPHEILLKLSRGEL